MDKSQVELKSDKNNGHFNEDQYAFFDKTWLDYS